MFKIEKFIDRKILKSSFINDDEITAFFTTRDLPLKAGEREDLLDKIEENKKLLCKGLNIPKENLIIPQQTHSDNVGIVSEYNSAFENTDALITNKTQIALALNFADCIPIIFYDPTKKIIAIAHAGWRGTVNKIGVKTATKMVEEFGSKPENIIALIGPAIGKCCFEAKEDVLNQLKESIDKSSENIISNTHADLKQINKIQLLAIGLKKIDVCEYCTSCSNELFFSYRKEKGHTARHSAVIILNN